MKATLKVPTKTVGSRSAALLAALYDRGQTTFSLAEAQAITGLRAVSTRSLLRKAVARGVIARIAPGLFSIVPPEFGSDSDYAGDPYLTARALVGKSPYYLSHSTAMELHRMVTQPWLGVFVSTSRRVANRTLQSTKYTFVFIKTEEIFGTRRHWITKQEAVVVSDLERTVIDGLRRPEYCGGIVEVAKALWIRHEAIKVEKLLEYAKRLDVGAVTRRLGYLLELYSLATSEDLNGLRQGLTKTYDVLDPVLPRVGRHIASWRLQLNVPAEELGSVRHT
jgi:predicted transcriptional regulator of viral defense system